MSHIVRLKDATFSNYVDWANPFLDQAYGFWLFGDDEESTVKNRTGDATYDLTPVGEPIYGPGYVEFPPDTLDNYFDTGLMLSGDFSLVAIHTEGERYIISRPSDGGNGPSSHFLGVSPDGKASFNSGPAGGFAKSDQSRPPGFKFSAGAIKGSLGGQLQHLYVGYNGDVEEIVDGANHPSLPSNEQGPIAIGPANSYTGGAAGDAYKLAAAMILKTNLGLEEMKKLYGYFRFKMLQRGIEVI